MLLLGTLPSTEIISFALEPPDDTNAIVNNWNFTSGLSNWIVINPVACFATPGNISWSGDYSGSAKVEVSGAPSDVSLVQYTIRAIKRGERIKVRVAHTETGNFANWSLYVGGYGPGNEKLHNRPGGQGSQCAGVDEVIWTADADYPTGTEIRLHTCVWPGSATFWWDKIEALDYSQGEETIGEDEEEEEELEIRIRITRVRPRPAYKGERITLSYFCEPEPEDIVLNITAPNGKEYEDVHGGGVKFLRKGVMINTKHKSLRKIFRRSGYYYFELVAKSGEDEDSDEARVYYYAKTRKSR